MIIIYILYTKKNIPELFLINNKDLKYDLNQINTLFCSKVDFPLYYFRDNIYSLTYELDKIPGNYIEDKQLQINNQVYYLTPFVPIKELENNNIISNKIKGKDWIKHYLYKDINVNGILYFLTIKQNNKIFYKVGISKTFC